MADSEMRCEAGPSWSPHIAGYASNPCEHNAHSQRGRGQPGAAPTHASINGAWLTTTPRE